MTKLFVKLLLVLVSCCVLSHAMTMKQIKQTGKMMRKTCQPKFNIPDDVAESIGQGKFVESNDAMCYMACILKMANTVKNGKLNYEASIKQVDMLLPDDMKDAAKKAITTCRSVAESYKDLCEAAYHTTKCIYDADPSVYIFP